MPSVTKQRLFDRQDLGATDSVEQLKADMRVLIESAKLSESSIANLIEAQGLALGMLRRGQFAEALKALERVHAVAQDFPFHTWPEVS